MAQILRPNPISYDEIDLSWMVGRYVVDVSCSQLQWRFSLGSTERIDVQCLWRIVQKEQIVLTCQDHDQWFGRTSPVDAVREAIALLSGIQITNAQIRKGTADIQVAFGTDLLLEIISDSCGYESWQIIAPAGQCYVAQGRGQLCTWNCNDDH